MKVSFLHGDSGGIMPTAAAHWSKFTNVNYPRAAMLGVDTISVIGGVTFSDGQIIAQAINRIENDFFKRDENESISGSDHETRLGYLDIIHLFLEGSLTFDNLLDGFSYFTKQGQTWNNVYLPNYRTHLSGTSGYANGVILALLTIWTGFDSLGDINPLKDLRFRFVNTEYIIIIPPKINWSTTDHVLNIRMPTFEEVLSFAQRMELNPVYKKIGIALYDAYKIGAVYPPVSNGDVVTSQSSVSPVTVTTDTESIDKIIPFAVTISPILIPSIVQKVFPVSIIPASENDTVSVVKKQNTNTSSSSALGLPEVQLYFNQANVKQSEPETVTTTEKKDNTILLTFGAVIGILLLKRRKKK
jgi:hypothetical protein